jgi:hypothetical protein
MKKSLIAIALATASLASSAVLAQTVGTSPQVLDLTDGSGFFGDTLGTGNSGSSFADRFTFTVSGADVGSSLDAVVSSISRTESTGVDITGLSLYSTSGRSPVTSGTSFSSGTVDVWTVRSDNLTAGSYYLQVNGTVLSDSAASFGGAVALAAPVPEPATYGMTLAGLGVLGFLARRRRTRQV